MQSRVYKASGIVLRRSNLGEKDRLVTFLTKERGKVRAVAKGARNPKSRLAGATELFNFAKLLLAKGRNFDIITQCEVMANHGSLAEDLNRMTLASGFVEVADALVEEGQPQSRLFFDLATAIEGITHSENPVSAARCFELHAMAAYGYAPVLDRCVSCGMAKAGRVALSPIAGGVVCESCFGQATDGTAITPTALRALRALSRISVEDACNVVLPPQVIAELARVWTLFLENRLERNLRSAQFARSVASIQTSDLRPQTSD